MQNYDEVEEKLKLMFTEGEADSKSKQNASQGPAKKIRRKKGKSAAKKKVAPAKNISTVTPVPINESQVAKHKYKGPCILIKNNRTKVMNFPNHDEEQDKSTNKSRVIQTKTEINQVRGMHASTLSLKYDATNTDETWLCAFCHRGPHKQRMGDLMGPILITESPNFDLVVKSPRKRSENLKAKKIEVWAHEDCVVSAAGVYIIGNKIIGLESAIIDSKEQFCLVCKMGGATVNCTHRNCNSKGHFICAREQDWSLPDDFRYFCHLHKQRDS